MQLYYALGSITGVFMFMNSILFKTSTGLIKGFFVIIIAGSMAGCFQTMQTRSPVTPKKDPVQTNVQPLSTISIARPGTDFKPHNADLKRSPWGDNITVKVTEQYQAASGNICLRVMPPKDPVALICSKNGQAWQKIRQF